VALRAALAPAAATKAFAFAPGVLTTNLAPPRICGEGGCGDENGSRLPPVPWPGLVRGTGLPLAQLGVVVPGPVPIPAAPATRFLGPAPMLASRELERATFVGVRAASGRGSTPAAI